ncbi:RNase adapter RapZ [Thiohalomonas denitrificans]|uniref:RNase adapter RapZ n=1 Tax=Thiohalomonas denitrificans TaxID=415747 RepID=UPI0026F2ABAA|nr:RNase adapter RapZ [Thiohalomonas denitrificans]
MRLFVVSGTSGAGKSVVLHALEDAGFYCIDNLPMGLLPAFAKELVNAGSENYQYAAVGVDARDLTGDLSNFPRILGRLGELEVDCRVVFLDADDATLIKRFSETRRRHPLTDEQLTLADAIRHERTRLEPISTRADLKFDTSRTTIHQLRDWVLQQLGGPPSETTSLLFESFGFKHGIPVDADFVFDVRCLPNPHWEPHLRALTGRDEEVAAYLQGHEDVTHMLDDIVNFLDTWLPRFEADRRSYVTVAVGCTGGQHRSVYLTEQLAECFRRAYPRVLTRHRELVH